MSQTKDKIVVSVIMTTYNHEAYIKQAITSVLDQETDFAFEIIIGNDASTDLTSQIISAISAEYPGVIKLIDRPRNIGASANLYDMIMQAQGKYISILDGDDFWVNRHKLQKQVDFLEDHREYIGCTHACSLVDSRGLPTNEPEPNWICRKRTYGLDDFKGYILPGQPSTMVFRNIFAESKHDHSIIQNAHRMIADRTLTVCLSVNGMFRRFDEPMSCYRISHSSNATAVLYEKNIESGLVDIDLSKKIEKFLWQEYGVRKRYFVYRLKTRVKYYIKKCLGKVWPSYFQRH